MIPNVMKSISTPLQSTLMYSLKLVQLSQCLAGIGPNHCGSLQCKIDTGASGNVMSCYVFAKLFPSCITTDDKPTRLCPCDTKLTVFNGSNIPQFGVLDIAIEWTPKGHQCSNHLQTRCYVADSPGPAILGIPSSSKLGIVPTELHSQTHQQTVNTPPTQETYNRTC